MANQARDLAKRLRGEADRISAEQTRRVNCQSVMEMAERHVAEAARHVEHQRNLIKVLEHDKHTGMLEHAHEVLDVLEQSEQLARAHLALEREFHGNRDV